jgi:glyoxylase-like metal-dependent hydrolase (beta-lactamase superfamily II)
LTHPANYEGLSVPFAEPPASGEVVEVAPGLLWVRLPLPFRLNHVNIYLIADGEGWAVIDAGIGDATSRAAWEGLMAGPLAGQKLTRLFVTHFHPDHIGLAGWLVERFQIPLLCSGTTYLMSRNIALDPNSLDADFYRDFYLRHGMDPDTVALVVTQGHAYLGMVDSLPLSFRRCVAGDQLRFGERTFDVIDGNGHAAEQLMLYCKAERILLAADQVMARITPNVSVSAIDPEGDPLGLYLRSLTELADQIDPEALVLPGHQLPFVGLQTRCRQIADHHAARCEMIAAACAVDARSVAEIVPVMFPRPLDPHQWSFAFSEAHAHVNYLVHRGDLVRIVEADSERFLLNAR